MVVNIHTARKRHHQRPLVSSKQSFQPGRDKIYGLQPYIPPLFGAAYTNLDTPRRTLGFARLGFP